MTERPTPQLPPTRLDPLMEVLFRSWAKAHGVDNHDDPTNAYDHRGVFVMTNGKIHPPHAITDAAQHYNAVNEGEASTQERLHGIMSDTIDDFDEHATNEGHNVQKLMSQGQKQDDQLQKQLMKRCSL